MLASMVQLLQLLRPVNIYFKNLDTQVMSKSVGIRTELLAQMAGVSEAELVHALKTTGEILGIKIPSPFPKNITPEREILIFLKVKHLQIK